MSNQYENYCHAINNKSAKKIKNPIILVPLNPDSAIEKKSLYLSINSNA